MKRKISLRHEFVEYIPNELVEGTIYVSIAFAIVSHKCCCGCGNEVVTPLSPTDWKVTFDGESISLYPSIGNWNFDCNSHYWIIKNRVEWDRKWSEKEINSVRHKGYLNKRKYYGKNSLSLNKDITANDRASKSDKLEAENNFLSRLRSWWS
ncbi:MAG: hypothetical protein HY807_05415 [Nitrospirae bacterium]|nr:hypothetical protein [Nitrospirota bacterium]